MQRKIKLAVGALATVGVVGVGAGVGVASGAGDEKPLRGNDYDRAKAAALEHVGKGAVTETETGDGGAAYEVEVRLDDGSQVEVELDDGFKVIGSTADDDGSGDVDEGGHDD